MPVTTILSPDEARRFLVGHHGLAARELPGGAAGIRALLQRLRCVQLDPLDRIGTNADLVAAARIDRIRQGDVYRHLMPGRAFEHFAKERCLLPASVFPYYRERAVQTPWWRLTQRLQRLPAGLVDEVLAEVRARGPLTAAELTDRGRVEAIDWSGWVSTSRAATMALEVLWTRCQVVVCGRTPAGKRFDIPERALPRSWDAPQPPAPDRWAVRRRVEAAGLLSTAGGPWWSSLSALRTSPLIEQMVRDGSLERVRLSGSRRSYLAPAGFRDRRYPDPDARLRILGPLDPMIWDRKLVHHAFDFEYVWEVYKPAEKRRWGWYVCPLLHRGRLVGRVDARRDSGRLAVERIWAEAGERLERAPLRRALERHARFLGLDGVQQKRLDGATAGIL